MDRRLNGTRGRSTTIIVVVGALLLLSAVIGIVIVAVQRPGRASTPVDVDTLVIGSGAGGLTLSYIASKHYGKRLAVVDNRDHVGGVVYSFRYMGSSDTRPVWGQTHAEQFLGRDVVMRLLTEKMGTPTVHRTASGWYDESFVRGINTTARICFGPDGDPPGGFNTDDGVPLCAAGEPTEGVAPNGWIGNQTTIFPGLPEVCPPDSWKDCSYAYTFYDTLFDPANLATITDDESLFGYMTRILGEASKKYLVEVLGMSYLQAVSARYYFTEQLPFESEYFRTTVWVPHGGPQVGLWDRVARVLKARQSRIVLNSTVTSVDYNTDPRTKNMYRYVVTVGETGQVYRAKKLVVAISSYSMRSLKGTVGSVLANSRFVKQVHAGDGCTWNAYWPDKFWLPSRQSCHGGLCWNPPNNYSYPNNTAEYAEYYISDYTLGGDSVGFAQYLASVPERKETGFMRFFFETEEQCAPFNRLLVSGGQQAVTNEMMRRLRNRLGNSTGGYIPDPMQTFFRFDNAYYPVISAGANFTAAELADWAREPIPGEKICAVSTTYQPLYGGWQEGAARSAISCLSGPVFQGEFSEEELESYQRGPATTTYDGLPKNISDADQNQLRPDCVLLSNEYNPRDWFYMPTPTLPDGLKCGGPSSYPWPTLAELEALPTNINGASAKSKPPRDPSKPVSSSQDPEQEAVYAREYRRRRLVGAGIRFSRV